MVTANLQERGRGWGTASTAPGTTAQIPPAWSNFLDGAGPLASVYFPRRPGTLLAPEYMRQNAFTALDSDRIPDPQWQSRKSLTDLTLPPPSLRWGD